MKVLIDISHPAHVHLFKHFIKEMENRGHKMIITARKKEVTEYLLNVYNLEYQIVSRRRDYQLGWGIEGVERFENFSRIIRQNKPDIAVTIIDPVISLLSKINQFPSIHLTDTEHAKLILKTTLPFADTILTPSSFLLGLGEKQIQYNGYHELAYLHPNYFKPDPTVLDELGLSKGDTFFILRFVSWTASHDIGQYGIKDQTSFVKKLGRYGHVFISSESKLPRTLEKYRIRIPPEKMHDLLYYATLYIGEGGTTASEAATLGTHAVHISTTAKYCGVFHELNRYRLLWFLENENNAINLIMQLLQEDDLYKLGKRKRKRLIKDKIDVTKFLIQFVENYPETSEGVH